MHMLKHLTLSVYNLYRYAQGLTQSKLVFLKLSGNLITARNDHGECIDKYFCLK